MMKLAHKILLTSMIVILPVLAACSGGSASAAAVNRIGQKVNCVCGGCELTVVTCNHNAQGACETAKKQVILIKKGLSSGKTDEQILKDMVGIYGQRALVK